MKEPKISVHILAKETTDLGYRLFKSCVESIIEEKNYAYEIIIIDNGCRNKMVFNCEQERIKWFYLPNVTNFGELRNKALKETSEECTHFHWVDTDECYPRDTLAKLKELAKNDDISAITTWFWHFMIDPTQWQEQQNKTNFYKLVPGIKWELPVHEHLVGYDKSKVVIAEISSFFANSFNFARVSLG